MKMKRTFVLALMAALLCLPMAALSEESKTEQKMVGGLTYEVTYPASFTCSQNVMHGLTIEFLWDQLNYAGDNNDVLWIPYKVNFSNNNVCNHGKNTNIISASISHKQADCTKVFSGTMSLRVDSTEYNRISVERLANAGHDYVFDQQDNEHHGKCKNGVCTATSTHEFSWGDCRSDGADSHTHVCSHPGCTIKETEDHSIGAWTVVKPATTTEVGTEQRACSECDYIETREVPRLPELPKTGDESNVLLWSALACISVLGMAAAACRKRKA